MTTRIDSETTPAAGGEGRAGGSAPAADEQARAAADEFLRLYFAAGEAAEHGAARGGERAWAGVRWMGVRALKLPLDLWTLQELVVETGPDLIIETGVREGGTTLFFASLFDLLGAGEVIGVDVDLSDVDERVRDHPRVTLLEGSSNDPTVVAHLAAAAAGRRVMVDLDSDHGAAHVSEELDALAQLVSPGCYLVVEDTIVNGNPVANDFGPGPAEAVERWLATRPPFEVDRSRETLEVSFNRRGYLRRIGDGAGGTERPAADAPATPAAPPGAGSPSARAPETASSGSSEEAARAERAEREVVRLRAALERRSEESDGLKRSLVHSSRIVRLLREELKREPERLAAMERLEEKLRRAWKKEVELSTKADRLEFELSQREKDIRALRTRLTRIHSSLPMRALNRLRWLPPLRWIFARRTRDYWRQLGA